MSVQTEIGLTPAECAALRVLSKDLEGKAKLLESGTGIEVDLMLHIKGTLSKGANSTQNRTAKPTPETVAAWFLSKLAPDMREKCLELFSLNVTSEGFPAVDDAQVRLLAQKMVNQASTAKPVPTSGSVKGALKLSCVDASKLKPVVAQALEEATRMINFDLSDIQAANGNAKGETVD